MNWIKYISIETLFNLNKDWAEIEEWDAWNYSRLRLIRLRSITMVDVNVANLYILCISGQWFYVKFIGKLCMQIILQCNVSC